MEDNKKAPNYLADQQDDEYAKPEWVRDTRGDLVMNLPGYTSMSFGVRAGSKIISTSTSDQSNNSTTSASSLSSGTITSTVAVGSGDIHGNTKGVTIDGDKSRITIGEYPATLGYSWIMDKNHIGGYQNTGLIFGMILQDGQYRLGTATGLTDMKKGEFMFGNYPTAYVRFIPATTSVDSHLIVHATLDGADGNFSGTLTSTAGSIGGWTIASNKLYAGSGSTYVGLDSGGTNPAIFAGNSDAGISPFRVYNNGDVYAKKITLAHQIDVGDNSAYNGIISMKHVSGLGDTAIKIDKEDFNYNDTGVIMGKDDTDQRAKMYINSDTGHLAFNGVDIEVQGTLIASTVFKMAIYTVAGLPIPQATTSYASPTSIS